MTETKKNSFMKGALILVAGNLITRGIGAAFKIPLTWLIGFDGMGLFTSAYNIYAFMFTILTSGFPIAISKMVAESLSKGSEKEAKRIFTISLIVLGILGALGAGVLYFGAHEIVTFLKNMRVEFGIMAIAPAIFFVAISCAFRGYFQGKQNMIPTALSNIMEALGKLVIGYIAAFFLLRWGIELATAGAIYGVAFGTALSALLLFGIFIWQKKKTQKEKEKEKEKNVTHRSYLSLAKQLFIIAIPITIGASVQTITNLADTLSITARLQLIPYITSDLANTMFGTYSATAVTIYGIPLTIIVALSTALVPNVASSLAEGDKEGARRAVKQALRITSLFAMPCAVGVYALATPILQTLYGASLIPAYAHILVQTISLSIFFSSLLSVSSAVLQAYGKMYYPVIFMIIGGLIKFAINWIYIPILGIFAAPISTNICYFLIIALNLTALAKFVKIKYDLSATIIKPLISCLALGAVGICSYSFLAPHLGIRISCLAAIILAALAYLLVLFLVKGITKDDIKLIKRSN